MVSRLQQVISQYRQQLLEHEAQATHTLQTAHAKTVTKLQPHLDQLTRQIAEKQASGEPVPVSWLYEQNRLKVTKALISGQINHFGALAKTTTGQLQHTGVQIGVQAGLAQLEATKPMGVSYSFGVPSQGAMESIVGATQKGSPLADLFDGFGAEAAEAASQALITGLTLGENPRRIASMVEDALDISRQRALTIARTECLRAYRVSNLETMRSNSDVVSQWRWTCDKSPRTCAACLAMDGTLHDLDEEMGSHPNCRCAPVPITKSWSDILGGLGIDTSGIPDSRPDIQSGSDWFDDQSEATQRSILGAKYDDWSNGDFTLKDVVGHSNDPDWGHSIYEKSLKQLTK